MSAKITQFPGRVPRARVCTEHQPTEAGECEECERDAVSRLIEVYRALEGRSFGGIDTDTVREIEQAVREERFDDALEFVELVGETEALLQHDPGLDHEELAPPYPTPPR